MSTYKMSVQRAVSESGAAWIKIVHDGGVTWLPAQTFSQSRSKVNQLLAQRGLHLAGRDELHSLFQQLGSAPLHDGAAPIDRSGWQGPCFTMPDRWVFCPDGHTAGPVVFPARFDQAAYSGTIDGWQKHVGDLLNGQPLLMFMVQAALAAPLRAVTGFTIDALFEIIAPSRSDLALLATVAYSATGAISPAAPNGTIPFGHILDHEGQCRSEYADLLLVADRAELIMAPETAARRGVKLRELLSSLTNSSELLRSTSAVLLGCRSLTDLVGAETEIGHEVARRSMCMKVSHDAPLGIFDRLPDDVSDATDFAAQLSEGTQQHYGTVLGRFIERLVHERATDPDRLRTAVQSYISAFVERTRVDRNNRDATQVAVEFGRVYAAGRLARRWGVLPTDWRCRSAILKCYRRLMEAPVAQRSFSDILEALAIDGSTIHYGAGHTKVPAEHFASAKVFVHHKLGTRELLIRKEVLAEVIPHWSTQKSMPEARAALIKDGAHLTPKRKLPGQRPTRMYAFLLKRVS